MHKIANLHTAAEIEREPLTRIAGRLTDGTIRKHLLQCGVELPPDGELNVILASGKTLAASDIAKIDAALDKAALSISERLRFKYALAQKGLLPKGRSVSFGLSPAHTSATSAALIQHKEQTT